jgi:hypothetical protein
MDVNMYAKGSLWQIIPNRTVKLAASGSMECEKETAIR